ncbi:MAG: DUF1598 domain-containing protein [Planctomycetaceae bacterium]|nr:DUF1598 domain-containing protein [Planctomycetaceae bacterium]
MRCRGLGFGVMGLLTAAAFLAVPSTVWSQTTGTTSGISSMAGIVIDADGVLRTRTFSDPTGQVMRERVSAARSSLDPKIASYSKLRKVSLNRLEQAIREHQDVLSEEMRYLAGLQRVRYVFYYPDSKDIVLAGPAEGWTTDLSGRVVGLTSGRPVIQLQDVVVALRMFPADGARGPMIGCSIDPTPEGLAAMQQFLRSNYPNPNEPQPFVEGLRNSLGYQLVRIDGVPPKTRFAQVMVEADYRMKLIGIGLEQPPVRLTSYVDRARPGEVAHNAMQRWFFLPDYRCVRESEDKLGMELVGDGVKLVGEDEVVGAEGQRRRAMGRSNKASQAFVVNFTKRYPELAERSPIYAELRNLIDVSIAAAYIQEQRFCEKAGWKMELFGSEKNFPVETYSVPKTVETAVNAVWKGQSLMTPVGGGVQIQANEALKSERLLSDEKGHVSTLRETVKPSLAKGQWWWD